MGVVTTWPFDILPALSLSLSNRLNRDVPLAAELADGGVLHDTQYIAAVSIAQPAKLRQENAAIGLI